MKQLNFDAHFRTRFQECKRQFQDRFWDEMHQQILRQVKQMIQGLIGAEFNAIIGAQPYERTQRRRTKRNGYYFRNLETRYGRIQDLKIPRARSLDVRFSLFDRWQQVESRVLNAMLQAYLLARSSRCAQQIIQSFDHSRFSRTFLQRLTHQFEEALQSWMNRPITKAWPYVFIDGMIVDVKELHLQKWCVLWAMGMDDQRNMEILGFLVLKTESQEGTERLLRDLLSRGLIPPRLIISDDSKAIEKGAAMVFPHTPQQGCIFHKVKATARYLRNLNNRKPFLRQAADIYLKAKNKRSLIKRLQNFKSRWKSKEPEAWRSLITGFERTITFLDFPKQHWSWIRTSNPMERFIEEVRDWTRRFGYFQGRGNLMTALFTCLCNKNPELVPMLNATRIQKDTILSA